MEKTAVQLAAEQAASGEIDLTSPLVVMAADFGKVEGPLLRPGDIAVIKHEEFGEEKIVGVIVESPCECGLPDCQCFWTSLKGLPMFVDTDDDVELLAVVVAPQYGPPAPGYLHADVTDGVYVDVTKYKEAR